MAWAENNTLRIPRVTRPPKIEDFINGTPREAEVQVSDFRQFDPGDGAPVSQPTTAYLSYDDKHIYVAYVCRDDPEKIRARVTRRDALLSDDRVSIGIDTFHDHRRNYWFDVNPYGIQMDGITNNGVDDFDFDTLWYSWGRLTADGYVTLQAIPFKSLRFPGTPVQNWGIVLNRMIQRNKEMSCWPYVSRRLLPGWTSQFGELEGVENISPGRNLQFIPYGLFSRARFLNPLADVFDFRTENDARAGLDAKMVLKDALTLDMALNPDFSQVESDEPQVTINYYPVPGIQPFRGNSFEGSLGFTLRPGSQLRLDKTYIFSRLGTAERSSPAAAVGVAIFNNHILRSKLNYQFTRELSLRAIVDYNSVLPNSSLVSFDREKRLSADILLTYLLHPGTALHIGYTDSFENLEFSPFISPRLRRTGFPDVSVGRQFFVKLSYLLRM